MEHLNKDFLFICQAINCIHSRIMRLGQRCHLCMHWQEYVLMHRCASRSLTQPFSCMECCEWYSDMSICLCDQIQLRSANHVLAAFDTGIHDGECPGQWQRDARSRAELDAPAPILGECLIQCSTVKYIICCRYTPGSDALLYTQYKLIYGVDSRPITSWCRNWPR